MQTNHVTVKTKQTCKARVKANLESQFKRTIKMTQINNKARGVLKYRECYGTMHWTCMACH